jgi:predicted transcriptional regulator
MAQKQNITVQLDQETIRRAKVIAAQRGTSVSQMLADTIAEAVREEDRYETARARAVALLRRGLHLGGQIRATRGELHER